jgi:hypothetical protein
MLCHDISRLFHIRVKMIAEAIHGPARTAKRYNSAHPSQDMGKDKSAFKVVKRLSPGLLSSDGKIERLRKTNTCFPPRAAFAALIWHPFAIGHVTFDYAEVAGSFTQNKWYKTLTAA